MTDDDDVLVDARTRPVAQRVAHAHWKARAECYAHVKERCARISSWRDDGDVVAFGASTARSRSRSSRSRAWAGAGASGWVTRAGGRRAIRTRGLTAGGRAGERAASACGDGNAAALDAGLDAVVALLGVVDVEYAGKYAEGMLDQLTTKGLGGRTRAVERATECCLLLIELEQGEVVIEALLKATGNKVPKIALAAANAVLAAVREFGTPRVISPTAILKGLAPLFDAKDAKVRTAAKEITVEMTRWLGAQAVKRDLIDKMREAMQADVNKAIANIESNARPTRFLRKDKPLEDDPTTVSSVAGDRDARDTSVSAMGASTSAIEAAPDAYEYSEPEVILPLLDKPGEGENPKFWDGIVSKKWQERQYALQTLTKLASAPRLAAADYGAVSKALKLVITKDSNVACVAEAARAAAALAKGARKDWTRDARILLPGMLDKLKDKTAAVIEALQGALSESLKHCFELGDVVEDVCVALDHKVPKVQIETLKWLARSFESMKRAQLCALHKVIVPPIVKCTSASNGDARNGAMEALAACAKTSGGLKTIEFLLMDIDMSKRSKIEELMTSTPKESAPQQAPIQRLNTSKSDTSAVVSSRLPQQAVEAATEVRVAPKEARIPRTGTALEDGHATISKDDAEARIVALLTADVINGLKSADWKERLAAISSVVDKVKALGDISSDVCDVLVIGLASFPGWNDSNFQVLDKMFETLEILSTRSCFEFRHVAAAFDVLGEKLGCFKLGSRAISTLMAISEALGPKLVIERLRERAGNHKAPKVVVGALNWAGLTASEFGASSLDIEMMVNWGREAMETPNPMIKGGGAKLIGALYAVVGPRVKDMLTGLKEAQTRSLEVEFARNPYEGDVAPKRTVRSAGRAPVSLSSVEPPSTSAANAPAPPVIRAEVPRTDISGRLNDNFMNNLNDANWKSRAAALEEIGAILKGANNQIAPNVGDLFKGLSARFADANRNVAATALNVAGDVALAIGPPIEKVGRAALADVVKYFGDSKKNVREAALRACTCWVNAAGLAKVLPTIAEKFQEHSTKITAEGKKEAIEWCVTICDRDDATDDAACASIVHLCAVGLMDKSTEARKASGALMEAMLAKVESETILSYSKSLGRELKSALDGYFNRSQPKSMGFKAVGSTNSAANSLKSTAAERNAARKAASLGSAARVSDMTAPVPSGPVFLKDTDKLNRIRRYPRRAMKFEPLRDEDMLLATNELKSASQTHFREDVHKMMFTNDIKAHLTALDAIDEAIKSNETELVNNFDLLLRWLVLRISESSPNTQVLTRVLDVVLSAVHAACDLDYKLVEQEAAILLPVIVEKSGHNIESMRDKFRKISHAIPTVYLASKFAGYVTAGMVETKSSRTRAECLDEIARLIERYGLPVCLREDKTLEHVVKFVETRDMSLRNCALNCLASAYKVAGDSVWKRIGQVPNEQVRTIISDKFARVSKEMSLNNEGTPGDWLNFNPIPIVSTLEGASVSKSVDVSMLATAKLASLMSSTSISGEVSKEVNLMTQSMSVLPSRTPLTHSQVVPMDVEMSEATAPVKEHVLIGAGTPKQVFKSSVTAHEARASAWSRAVSGVNDLSEEIAVEAMKTICHEIVNAKDNVSAHTHMASDIDALVLSLAKRIEHAFITAIATPAKGTRTCRYLLNALMHVHEDRAFATSITEPTQRVFIEQLVRVLLDERIVKLNDGDALMKAANMLMIAMMENCTRSYSFVAFLTLLHDRPKNVPAQFDSILVKCLVKLTRSLQLSMENVHIPTVLGAVHRYFEALGMEEVNTRAKFDDQGLRAAKTLLHEITVRVGDRIFEYCSNIPSRSAVPTPIIYSFISVNLKAPKAIAAPSTLQFQIQSQTSPMGVKSQLVAIFKKIGEKDTTTQGLEELYVFTRDHPEEDLTPHLERTSEAFQMYIKRGLQKVEAAQLRKSVASHTSAVASPTPSPVMEAKSSAAVYRERLAQLQENAGAEIVPTKPIEVDDALTDLERLRRRMNSINAKATGQSL